MLRRRDRTLWSTADDNAAAASSPVIVSPEQIRRRSPTTSTAAAASSQENGDGCHLSSCSSSSFGGSSTGSGSSGFRRGALGYREGGGHHSYYARHRLHEPQHQHQHQHHERQPQLHRRHSYAGEPIAAAAVATAATTDAPLQRQSIAIEIPVAMKEVIIRHSRSRLRANAEAVGDDNDDDDNDANDGASTLSSLEVDLGHDNDGSEPDPRRQYWAERKRGTSHNTTASTSVAYSSTKALCGGEGNVDGTTKVEDGRSVDDDEPSYMSYSFSTSSPCKFSAADRSSGGSRTAAARSHHPHAPPQRHRRPPGHVKNPSKDSSLGGLGLLDITGERGRSVSPSRHKSDSLFRIDLIGQDQQAVLDLRVDETARLQQRKRSHRRHFSESVLLNTSIGTDTDTTADSRSTGSHCLFRHPRNYIDSSFGSTFGPLPSSLAYLPFSSTSPRNLNVDKGGGREGTKRKHRQCASAGCGLTLS